jgi:hypothetical protein
MRGFIRIARQFNMPAPQRAEMCRQALKAAKRPDEQLLVLDVLERYPNRPMLEIAVELMDDPRLKDRASKAVMAIAGKLTGKDGKVQDLLAKAGLEKVNLEIVKATYGAGDDQTEVTEVLQRHAGGLPLIALPGRSFNSAFGGDPAPGTPKQLTIEYIMDGKPGKATIGENALILLPVPE